MKNELNTIATIAQHDFLTFAKMVLRELDGTVIDNDPYIELLATYLMDFADGSTKRLLINMPARHGKTKLASVDGNMRATTALLSLFARDPLDADPTDETTPEERAVLDEYFDREVRRRAAANSTDNSNDPEQET